MPKTVMPSVLITAWSLLLNGLVTFFLQSTMMVTLFFSTLIATRCHLCSKMRDHRLGDIGIVFVFHTFYGSKRISNLVSSLLLHNKKVLGSIPSLDLGYLCVNFACSPCACMGFLQVQYSTLISSHSPEMCILGCHKAQAFLS